MLLKLLRILLILFLLVGNAQAATYYIDSAAADNSANGTTSSTPWKVSPGMVGCDDVCAAYTHAAGDIFLFKGGSTWTAANLPLTIPNSGTSGNVDVYRVATSAEWTGSTGYAIFDGEATDIVTITATSKDYVRINGFDTDNVADGSNKAIVITNCNNIEIDGNRIRPDTWLGIYYSGSTAATYSNLSIHDNDISHCAMGVAIGLSGSNVILDNVDIYDNDIHDFTTEITGTRHGDGIHLWGVSGDNTSLISNVSIYNNYFYGSFARTDGTASMTAHIYLEYNIQDAEIYNNLMTFSDAPDAAYNLFGPGFIYTKGNVSAGGGHKIYNNTMVGTYAGSDVAMSAAVSSTTNDPNIDIQNNIMHKVKYCYSIGTATGITIDYNDANFGHATDVGSIAASFKTWAEWQTAGYDGNGIHVDPSLDASFKPDASDDPIVDVGADLSATLTTDKDGSTRPQGTAFEMGAYEFPAGVTNSKATITGAATGATISGSSSGMTMQ